MGDYLILTISTNQSNSEMEDTLNEEEKENEREMAKCESFKTQCKIRVNLGFTEPYKGEITVLHRKNKNQKTKNIRC